MWLVAIVMDTAFLNTTKVNVQQLKMHLKKKKRIFSSLRSCKKARKSQLFVQKESFSDSFPEASNDLLPPNQARENKAI